MGEVCEVCGAPAQTATLDTVVIDPPITDESGQMWSCAHGEGGYHVRCSLHPYYMKTRNSTEYEEWERRWFEKSRQKRAKDGS